MALAATSQMRRDSSPVFPESPRTIEILAAPVTRPRRRGVLHQDIQDTIEVGPQTSSKTTGSQTAQAASGTADQPIASKILTAVVVNQSGLPPQGGEFLECIQSFPDLIESNHDSLTHFLGL